MRVSLGDSQIALPLHEYILAPCRSFYVLGASIFNSLPLSLRNINSRFLFRKALDDLYL